MLGGLGVAGALGCGVAPAAQPRLPSLPFPAVVESVIEQGEIEGQPVSIARFHTGLGQAAVAARLAREWSGPGGSPMVESSSGPWRVLSWWSPQAYRTVQLRDLPGGGSEGLLSLWRSGDAQIPSGLDPVALLPPDARVLRQLSSLDAGRRSRTLVAMVPGSLAWAGEVVGQRLAAHGFSPDPVMRAGAQGGARLYRRRGAELALTVAPHDGRTALVLHLIEESR